MIQFLQLLRDILWLRRGPQDLPYSPVLFAAVCAAVIVLRLAVPAIFDMPGTNLTGALFGLIVDLALLYFVLSLRGFTNRFVQTGTALVSCTLVFLLIVMPIALIVGVPPKTPEQVTGLQGLMGLIALVVLVWKFVVDAHILRHALAIPFLAAMGVAILWLIAETAFGAALQSQAILKP
jgi:hypothetical protein